MPDRLLVGRLEIMDVDIAARTFELAYYVKVKGASLENGLLHVDPRARDSGGDEASGDPNHELQHRKQSPPPIESLTRQLCRNIIQGRSPLGRSRSR